MSPSPVPTPTPSPPGADDLIRDAIRPDPCDVLISNPAARAFCEAHSFAQDVGSRVGGAIIDQIAHALAEASDRLLSILFTWWVQVPTSPLTAPFQGQSGPVQFVITHTQWYVAAFAVLGLLIAAGRLAIERRPEAAGRAVVTLVALVVVTSAGTTVIVIASQAADAYSVWILERADRDWSGTFTRYTSLLSGAAAPGLPGGMMLILALLGLISSLIQLILMIIRAAMLGLLAGALPLIAATVGTESGRSWARKAGSWLLAWLLYKPVAATIYAYAIVAMDEPNDEITKLSGFVIIVLAVLALPALMRFLTPMVATIAQGGGGGAAMEIAAVTGARLLPHSIARGVTHVGATGAAMAAGTAAGGRIATGPSGGATLSRSTTASASGGVVSSPTSSHPSTSGGTGASSSPPVAASSPTAAPSSSSAKPTEAFGPVGAPPAARPATPSPAASGNAPGAHSPGTAASGAAPDATRATAIPPLGASGAGGHRSPPPPGAGGRRPATGPSSDDTYDGPTGSI